VKRLRNEASITPKIGNKKVYRASAEDQKKFLVLAFKFPFCVFLTIKFRSSRLAPYKFNLNDDGSPKYQRNRLAKVSLEFKENYTDSHFVKIFCSRRGLN